ncbi:MAG: sugar phosphate nucleotidyltransferase [Fidelibacterota bacterium]
MKAIILAAGVSRRLYPLTYTTPKCLLKVGPKTIIDYQLSVLEAENITEVIVVVGYHRDAIIEHLRAGFPKLEFRFVTNEHFFETNTAYSLYLCQSELKNDEMILMNGDVLYPREVLRRILDSDDTTTMAVEIKPCGREEVKVIEGENRKIVAIGKELIEENALGEFLGLARFSSDFVTILFQSLEQLIEGGGTADYFEAAIHPLLNNHPVHYVDVSDLPCIEIDFIEDLNRAQQLIKSEYF